MTERPMANVTPLHRQLAEVALRAHLDYIEKCGAPWKTTADGVLEAIALALAEAWPGGPIAEIDAERHKLDSDSAAVIEAAEAAAPHVISNEKRKRLLDALRELAALKDVEG